MTILFVYYNEGFILKAYEFEEQYFVEFSFLELRKIYFCPDKFFALNLAKVISNFYTEDLQRLKKYLDL